jgi:hypothetical protein
MALQDVDQENTARLGIFNFIDQWGTMEMVVSFINPLITNVWTGSCNPSACSFGLHLSELLSSFLEVSRRRELVAFTGRVL